MINRTDILFIVLFVLLQLEVHAGDKRELTELKVGQRICVSGTYLPEGVFLANKATFKDAAEYSVLEGKPTGIDSRLEILQVLGFKVVYNIQTKVLNNNAQQISLAELPAGSWIRVRGKQIRKRLFLAVEIQKLDEQVTREESIESEIQRLSYGTRIACLMLNTPVVFKENAAFLEPVQDRGIKRDDDDQQPVPLRIGNFLTLGGKVEFELEPQENLDLDRNSGENEIGSQISLKQEILTTFHSNIEAYAKLKLKRKPVLRLGDVPERGSTEFQTSELYLTYYNLFNSQWQLRLGRQRFKDKREWLFDENLDAVRLIFDTKKLDVQLAFTDGSLFIQDDENDEINQHYFYLNSCVKIARRTYLNGFFLARRHHNLDEAVNWLGVGSRGRIFHQMQYWANIASVFGNSQGNTVQGFGFDLGMNLRTNSVKPLSLTLGYASGSGDSDPKDNVDYNFLQTGLQGNSAKLNGLKRIKYYGEVFDPELSNIRILTVGLGMQPTLKSSLELVFHSYRQFAAQNFLRNSNLDADPRGLNTDLGKEIDLTYTFREISNVDLGFTLGYFRSGPAFGEKSSNVLLGKLKMQLFY